MKTVLRRSPGDTDNTGGTRSTRWSLSSLALSMLLSSLGTSIPNVALPTFASAFSASFGAVQWIVLAYLLAITVMIVSMGRLGDVIGHRRLLLTGLSLFTAASLLCGIAPTLWVLVLARAMQGLGAAVLLALTIALVQDAVPKEKTGSAMGLLGTMSAIGTALGPSLGGVILAGPGWRAIFLIMVPLGIVNLFLAFHYLPLDRQKTKSKHNGFDGMGTLLLGVTLAAYTLAVTVGDGNFGRFNLALLLAAVLGGVLFILAEKRMQTPLIQLTVFRDVLLSASLSMNLLASTVIMSTLVVGPFYLSGALGLNDALVGLIMSIGPVTSAMSGVPAGRIVDRLGAPAIVIVGLIQMAVGAFALSLLPGLYGTVGYIAALIILTPGYQLFLAANNTQVMMDVEADRRGVISGMLNLSRNLGLTTGASVMGAVFAFAAATTDITAAPPDDVATGMQITFMVAGSLIIVALGIGIGGRVVARRHA